MDAMKAEHVDTLRDFVKLAREATSYIGMMADDDDEIVNLRERIGDAEYAIAALAQQVPADGELSAEDRAVLLRLKNALPDVGLNGWIRGVAVLDKILAAPPQAPKPTTNLSEISRKLTVEAPQPVVGGGQPQQGAVGEVRMVDGCIYSTAIKRPLPDGAYDIVPQTTAIGQQAVDDAVQRNNRILMRLDWLERGETIDMDEFRADVTAALAAHGKRS